MDCDDVLAPQALYEVAYLLNENQELDFIYSDEDKITEECQANREGKFAIPVKDRHTPFFKPDWSPDAFMCLNYTNHLSVYRTEIVKEVGGLRTKYNGQSGLRFCFALYGAYDKSARGTCRQNSLPLARTKRIGGV